MTDASRGRFYASLASLAVANATAYALVRAVTSALGDTALPPATRPATVVMVLAFAALTCLASLAVVDFSHRRVSPTFRDRMAVLAASLAIFGVALAFPPVASADNAWNLLMGRAWSVYGANPYLVPASAFAADPAFSAVSPTWHAWTAVYGPLWTMVSGVPAYLAASSEGQRLALRLVCVMGYVAAGVILRAGLCKRRPAAAEAVFAFWLLNPAAAFEIANAGHNEGVLLPFLALAAIGLAEGGLAVATAGIVGAALVKVWPIVLLPTLAGVPSDAKRRTAVGLSAAAAFVSVWSVFWGGAATLAGLARHASAAGATYFYAPFRFAVLASAKAVGFPDPVGIAQAAAFVVAALAVFFITARTARGTMTPLLAALAVMTAYHGIWLNWLQPWHLLAFAPFVAIVADGGRAVAFLALLGMLGLSFYAAPPWFVAGGLAVLAFASYASSGKRKKSA